MADTTAEHTGRSGCHRDDKPHARAESKLAAISAISNNDSTITITTANIRPTLKRYIILLLFCLNSANKAFQWMQVPASTIKATRLYQVDNYAINFASTIFHLAFLLLSWPSCLIIERIGLRKAVLTASFGTVIGSLVKCASCSSSGVYLLLLGQVFVALSEQLIFSLPTRLASVWFPDHQVSLMVSLCILGGQLGVAFGFIVPKWFLEDAETDLEIGAGFYGMFQVTTAYSASLFILNWLLFDEAPRQAPGAARLRQIEVERQEKATRSTEDASLLGRLKDLLKQIFELSKNRDLVLIGLSYGISFGRGDTISTILDQTMQPLYPGNDSVIGITGYLVIVAGALGSPVWGRAMDKYRAYKSINIILSICTILTLALFGYVLIYLKSPGLVYLGAILFGFFQTGFLVASLEYAVELTYPAPELVTSSFLNCIPSVIGPAFIFIASYIVDNFGALATFIFYSITLLVALVTIMSSRERLKRQEAIQLEMSKGAGSLSPNTSNVIIKSSDSVQMQIQVKS